MKKYVDEKKKVILMLGITGVGKSSLANTFFWR
jgi:predicted GTPase